jgi:lysophospholipid acyltransferase (LPLAT)-like uncharacterized protein
VLHYQTRIAEILWRRQPIVNQKSTVFVDEMKNNCINLAQRANLFIEEYEAFAAARIRCHFLLMAAGGLMKEKRWLYYALLKNIGVPIIYVAFRLFSLTLRFKWRNREHLEPLLRGDKPVIFAFWHQDLVATTRLGAYARRFRPIAIMTSLSRDGEVYSILLRWLGFTVVRGSSSRGAVRGIIRLKRALESGTSVAVAVDGPLGRPRVVKPGVVLLAKLTDAPIVPFTILLARKKTLHSWDACEVPAPFSHGEVIIHPPVYVPPAADHQTIEAIRKQLEQTLLEGKKS